MTVKTARLSECETFRYTLGRQWGDGGTYSLPIIMLNPSTADHTDDDPTIKRCVAFALREGYGGIHVVNLIAYRSPHPKITRELHANGDDVIGPENDNEISGMIHAAAGYDLPVLCAWGNGGDDWPERVAFVKRWAAERKVRLVCLGTTASGAPKHPLARGKHRIADDQPFLDWGAAA